MSTVEEIHSFLEGLRNLYDKPKEFYFNTLIQRFEEIKATLPAIEQEAVDRARKEAPDFNIFSLLWISQDELRQSAFLANLLNPSGTHGQGELFLKSFLCYCIKKFEQENFPPLNLEFETTRWIISTETSIGNGRLDILIQNPSLGNLIVIENKVFAYEQPTQLERYCSWMENRKKEYPNQVLLFLTINGYSASTSNGYPYFSISYRDDIPSWLGSIVERINPHHVREILREYCNDIRNL